MALIDKLNKIEALKNIYDLLMPMTPENERRLWKKVRLDWNFNSNHIEGNTLTYSETKLLLVFEKIPGSHDAREYEEMKAHDVAIHLIKDWATDKKREITEAQIRELNKLILVKPFWKDAITLDGQPTRRLIKVGEYKEHPNSVIQQNGEMFHYASPAETPQKMFELMQWYKNNSLEHPLLLAAQFHYSFIRIHPFDDGNGRGARLLVNYILMKHNYPPIVIKSDDKKNYILALNRADSGDLVAFHEYMADQLITSLELSIKAAKGEEIEEIDDAEKELAVWKKQFSGVKTNVMPKSDSQIYEIYNNGIRNLFEMFLEKMKQFDDLFTSKEITGWINGGNKGHRGLEFIEESFSNWANQQGGFLNAGEAPPMEKFAFNNLRLRIAYKGFTKDGTNAFDYPTGIEVEFQQYVYVIRINHEQVKEYLYSEYINHEEAKEIVMKCIKTGLGQIKMKIKNG